TELTPGPEPVVVLPHVETGVPRETLDEIVSVLHSVPEGFHVHPKREKQLSDRLKLWQDGEVDWSLGEGLALGTLLLDGNDVRMAGQDTRRGTFSHRHAVLVDHETEAEYLPLAHVAEATGGGAQGRFFIYDSSLSEYAALGFEYGYSVAHK